MRLLHLLRRRLRRFAGIDNGRRLLLAEAALWLWLARMALIFFPFPRIARRLGDFVSPTDARVAAMRGEAPYEEMRLASEVGWAVTRAARYVPFRAVCLPQAMAARIMLTRRGVKSVLHFGAARGKEKALDAHAWLDAAGVDVTGYEVAGDFTEIGSFV